MDAYGKSELLLVFAFTIRLCLDPICELFGDELVVLLVTKNVGHLKSFWKREKAFGDTAKELVTCVPLHPAGDERSANGYHIVLVTNRSDTDNFFFGDKLAMDLMESHVCDAKDNE